MSFLRRLPGWLQSVLAATVGVYVVYLVAANVILRTSLLRGWLRADDGSLVVEYASARSLYPGHVVANGLAIRFEDDTIQMGIGLDKVALDIDLWMLAAHHTARFDGVRGANLDYRLRLKTVGATGKEPRIAAFPPIEGFADPPIVKPPQPASGGRPWTIEIRDLEVSVHQVWAMEYRFRGDATVSGGFRIEPQKQVYVTPSRMFTRTGTISLGGHDFLRSESWTIDAQLDPFVPQEPKGVEVLHYINYAVHQHGDVVSLVGPGEMYLPPGLALEGGAGPIAIDVHVDHGIVQPDARITYHAAKVGFRSPGLAGAGDVDVVAHVASEGAPHVVAEAKVGSATLSPATVLGALHGAIELGGVDTTAPVDVKRVAGSVGKARIGDVRAWRAIAPESVTFDGGALTSTGRAEYREGALTGHVETSLENVAMTVGPFSFVASGKTSTDLASADVAKEIRLPGVRADLENISVKLLDGHAEHMWLRARSADARIATSQTATDANIDVVSGPGDQNLKLFTRMASIPDIAADITHGASLSASVHLRVRHDDIALGVVTARNGILGARGRIHQASGRGLAGALLLSVGPVNAGLDLRKDSVSVHPLASGEWLDETLAKR